MFSVASAESRRMAISLRLISREKITVVWLCLIAADRATSRASVELCVGMNVRPARYRCEGWSISMHRTGTESIGSTEVMKR